MVKKVGGGDRSPMRPQEGLPTRRPSPSRIDSVLRQDSLDRVSADGVPEICKRPGSGCTPSRVVARHLEDQALDLAGDPRSTRTASRAPVVFPSDVLPVPAEQRIRRDDRRDLVELSSSEWLCLSGEAATL